MKKYTFGIGLNDKNTYKQICTENEGCVIVRDIATKYFGGCSVYPAHGAYMHECGYQIKEDSVICFVYGDYQW